MRELIDAGLIDPSAEGQYLSVMQTASAPNLVWLHVASQVWEPGALIIRRVYQVEQAEAREGGVGLRRLVGSALQRL